MKKIKRIPTILVVLIMSLGLGLGVVLIQYKSIFRLRANPNSAPANILVSNITDSSFTVSWTTDTQTLGALNWGLSPQSLDKLALSADQRPQNIHYITVNDLVPNTDYYFKIQSSGEEFDNSGIPWRVTTTQKKSIRNSSQISGVILSPGGQPAPKVIVSLNVNGNSLSALTSTNGSWIISLGTLEINDNTLVQILMNGGPLGVSSAQIYPVGITLLPPIVLGKTYDFRSLVINNPNLPAVQLQVPNSPTP